MQDEELVVEQVGGYSEALPEGWRQAELITNIISSTPGLLAANNGNSWRDWTAESYGSAGLTLFGILLVVFLLTTAISTAYRIVFGSSTPVLSSLDVDELEETFESCYTHMTVYLKFKAVTDVYAELKRRLTDHLSALVDKTGAQPFDQAIAALEALVTTVRQRLSAVVRGYEDDPELAVVSVDALEKMTQVDTEEDARYQRKQEESFQSIIPDAAAIEQKLRAAIEAGQDQMLLDAIVLAEAYDEVLTQVYADAVMTLEEVYASEDRSAEMQARQRLAEELAGLQQLHMLQSGAAAAARRGQEVDEFVYHSQHDGVNPQAPPARTVDLSDDLEPTEQTSTTVVRVKHEESLALANSSRAMDTVVATVQHQTQILTEMHTSQWNMEAYRCVSIVSPCVMTRKIWLWLTSRFACLYVCVLHGSIKRENETKLQQITESKRKGRAARKHQALMAARTRKENLEREKRERQMTFSLHNPTSKLAHALGNAELYRLKDSAAKECKKQFRRQVACDWQVLLLTVVVQALIFVLYYNNPYLTPKDFASTIMEHRGVNVPAVATQFATKGWNQLCNCLAETDSRLSSDNDRVRGFLPNPSRRQELDQEDAIAREFDGSRIRRGFAHNYLSSYDDVVQRSVQEMSRVWLGPLADVFNLGPLLQMSTSLACLLRLSVRLLIPTMVHTLFSYVR